MLLAEFYVLMTMFEDFGGRILVFEWVLSTVSCLAMACGVARWTTGEAQTHCYGLGLSTFFLLLFDWREDERLFAGWPLLTGSCGLILPFVQYQMSSRNPQMTSSLPTIISW